MITILLLCYPTEKPASRGSPNIVSRTARSLHGILQFVRPISLVLTWRRLRRLCWCDGLTAALVSVVVFAAGVEASLGDGVAMADEELERVAGCMSFPGVSDVCVPWVDGSRARL